MATLYVRDIPDALYRQLRSHADVQGSSLSAYIVRLLRESMNEEQLRERRRRAISSVRRRRRRLPAGAPDSVEMIRMIRSGRE